ncbi:hypothetical protein ACJJTC_007683 [Scirpophaga incertulas]
MSTTNDIIQQQQRPNPTYSNVQPNVQVMVAELRGRRILLSGLPEQFDVIVSSLSCFTSSLTSEIVRTRLLQEEFRRNGSDNGTAYIAKKKSGPAIVCDYCKKPGHSSKMMLQAAT